MVLVEHTLKNAYIGEYITKLEYDFTQSDGGWTKSSTVSRSSSGFYVSGANVDGYIFPPSQIYNNTPKKIQIIFNRPDSSCGTGISSSVGNYSYLLPRNYGINRFDWVYNGTVTQNNISLGTGNITWELDIDSSITNRTITHKITGNSDITETSGILKYMWDNKYIRIRTVHWNSNATGPYIKKVIIEY